MSNGSGEKYREEELTIEPEDLPEADNTELLSSEELVVDPEKPVVQIDGRLMYYDGDTSLYKQRRSDNWDYCTEIFDVLISLYLLLYSRVNSRNCLIIISNNLLIL